MTLQEFQDSFETLTGHMPFPWQEELLARFLAGIGKWMSLHIPTGLGKTKKVILAIVT